MTTPRRLLALLICFAFSGCGLLFFFRGTEWGKLGAALRGGNYLWLIPALLLTLCTYVVRAYRWQILMNPIKRIRWIHLLSATTIGFMANCVMPGRLGELVRATAIGLKEKMSAATALTTVLVERVFDLFGVAFFGMVVLIWMSSALAPCASPSPSGKADVTNASVFANDKGPGPEGAGDTTAVKLLRRGGYGVGISLVGAIVLLVFMKLYPSATLAIGRAPLKFLPQALSAFGERILMGLVAGLASLASPLQVLYLAVLSVFHWGLGVLSNMVLGYCFGLHFSLANATLIFVITAIAVAVPQGPGFVGVFDYFGLKAVEMLLVGHNTAQSYTIVLHFIAVVPVTIMGFCFLWWEGLSFRQVTGEKDKES